jgi:hypothetical protein
MRRVSLKMVGLGVAVALLSACSHKAPAPRHTLTVTVVDGGFDSPQSVVVTAPNGNVIGTAQAQFDSSCFLNGCSPAVQIHGLPPESSYGVKVGSLPGWAGTFSASELQADGWSVDIQH